MSKTPAEMREKMSGKKTKLVDKLKDKPADAQPAEETAQPQNEEDSL